MKKISLIGTLFIAVLLLQNCKKDTVSAVTYSSNTFSVIINDTSWTPTTLTAAMSYNTVTKAKIFSLLGSTASQQISFFIKQNNSTNSPSFPIATSIVDSIGNVSMTYFTLQKNNAGATQLLPFGKVSAGAGAITISAVDSVKKVISGTFNFTAVRNNYDGAGNIVSVSVANITSGAFNKLPYTYTAGTD